MLIELEDCVPFSAKTRTEKGIRNSAFPSSSVSTLGIFVLDFHLLEQGGSSTLVHFFIVHRVGFSVILEGFLSTGEKGLVIPRTAVF